MGEPLSNIQSTLSSVIVPKPLDDIIQLRSERAQNYAGIDHRLTKVSLKSLTRKQNAVSLKCDEITTITKSLTAEQSSLSWIDLGKLLLENYKEQLAKYVPLVHVHLTH